MAQVSGAPTIAQVRAELRREEEGRIVWRGVTLGKAGEGGDARRLRLDVLCAGKVVSVRAFTWNALLNGVAAVVARDERARIVREELALRTPPLVEGEYRPHEDLKA